MGNVQSNATALPVISDDTEASLLDALQVIFRTMAPYSATTKLDPSTFNAADRGTRERMVSRAFNAIDALAKDRKEREVSAFRAAVKDAIAPHIDAARAEKAEFDALSPSLKAKLGAFPTSVNVAVADLADAFPGLDVAAQVKKLHDMGYRVVKAANGSHALKIELPKSIVGETAGK